MLDINDIKIPSVCRKIKRKIRRNSKSILLISLIIIIIFFIFLLKDTKRQTKPETVDYPLTPLANLDEKYANWSLSHEIKKQLWEALQKSPINPKTGRHCLMVFLSNAGMTEYTLNSLCSLQSLGIEKNQRVTIALDDESYESLKQIDEPVILFRKNFTKNLVNNNKIVDFYNIVKIRPTIVHQFLLWNAEFIHCDSDTVFLKDPTTIFNDEADYEVQCDSKEYYQIPYKTMPVPWQVNLGFYKVHPTKVLLKLLPMCLKIMYESPKRHDQSSMRKILKKYHTTWLNEDTVIINTTKLFGEEAPNITFRFLDPMTVTNAGGLFQEGKENWKNEAKRRNIDMPTFIHFFHVGHSREKKTLMVDNNLWFLYKNNTCLKEKPRGAIDFNLWK